MFCIAEIGSKRNGIQTMKLNYCLIIAILLVGCANHKNKQEHYQASWFGSSAFKFNSALSELYKLNQDDDELFIKYILPTSKDSYREILARSEVGLPIDDLIENKKSSLNLSVPNSYYSFVGVDLTNYVKERQGFGIDNIRLNIPNPEVETILDCSNTQSGAWIYGRDANCFPVIAPGYGFTTATLYINTKDWILPVTPENAVGYLKEMKYSQSGKLGDKKTTKVNIMLAYQIEKCEFEKNNLTCVGTLSSGEVHATSGKINSSIVPIAKLVKL